MLLYVVFWENLNTFAEIKMLLHSNITAMIEANLF